MRGGVGLTDHYGYVAGTISEADSGSARAYPLEISPLLPEPLKLDPSPQTKGSALISIGAVLIASHQVV
jgi:hypothetical protein